MAESAPGHDDHVEIPRVIDVIESLWKDIGPEVQNAKAKVEVWKYNSTLVFKENGAVVSFSLFLHHVTKIDGNRIWTCLISAVSLFILANSFANHTADLIGINGAHFMFSSLIITVCLFYLLSYLA